MDGLKLKKILIGKGYMLKDIASKLGMTQPNFIQIIKAQDIKTGTLENICQQTAHLILCVKQRTSKT